MLVKLGAILIFCHLMRSEQFLQVLSYLPPSKHIFRGIFCFSKIVGIWVTEIDILDFSAFLWRRLENGHLTIFARDMLLATCLT